MITTGRDGADIGDAAEGPALTRGLAEIAANPADVAEYVADYTEGLARLARASKLNLLAYLLDIAHLEAQTVLGGAAAKRRDLNV